MASVSEIKAQIEKKKDYLNQVPTVKKELKFLESQLKTAEVEEFAAFLNDKKIEIETLKKAIIEGNIVLPDGVAADTGKAEKEKT